MKKVVLAPYGTVEGVETWGSDEGIVASARMSTDGAFRGWGPLHQRACPEFGAVPPMPKQNPALTCCPSVPGDEKLLHYLWAKRHTSPFEQAGLTIEVYAPIMVFREWHRHRTQSFNEMSGRYIQMPDEHYVPTVERCRPPGGANRQAAATTDYAGDFSAQQWLDELTRLQAEVYAHYERGLKLGIPKEIARLLTPVNRYSRMRASANLLNWIRFLGLRDHPAAQQEIQVYAREVRALLTKAFPRTMACVAEAPI